MPKKITHNAEALKEFSIEIWPADSICSGAHDYRDQIISNSRQPHVLAWEPEDAEGRFANVDAYEQWAKQGRAIVGLIKDGEICGITYFGRKNPPVGFVLSSMTVGLRMYESAVGRGLARPFFVLAHSVASDFVDTSDIWLTARDDNVRALAVYESAGYQKEGLDSEGLIVMRYDRR